MERFGTVAIIGVGLIGGSIGLALRSGGSRRTWSESVAIRLALDEAARNGAIDRGTTDFDSGVAEADLVIVCTPVNRIAEDVLSRRPGRTC